MKTKNIQLLISNDKVVSINKMNIFLFYVLMIIITYAIFTSPHFSIDTYTVATMSNLPNHFIGDGRLVTALATWILSSINFIPSYNQIFSIGTLIGCLAIGMHLVTIYWIDLMETPVSLLDIVLVSAGLLIAGINVFVAELFMFPELSFMFGIGILLVIIAAKHLDKNNDFFGFIISFILLLIALNIYQVLFEIFIIVSFYFLLPRVIDRQEHYWRRICLIISLALISSLASIYLSKFVSHILQIPLGPRTATLNIHQFLQNVDNVIKLQFPLWKNGLLLFPNYVLLAFVICLTMLLLFNILKDPVHISRIFFLAVIFIFSYAIIFSPHLISTIFWPAPRTMIALFFFFALFAFYFSSVVKSIQQRRFVILLFVLFFIVNVIQIQQIGANQKISNALDKQFALMVADAIMEYENATGNKVTKFATRNDSSPLYGYYSIVKYVTYETNVSARITDYSVIPMINYYTGLNLSSAPMDPEIYETQFQNKNWDEFVPEEQMFFVGDTLFMIQY